MVRYIKRKVMQKQDGVVLLQGKRKAGFFISQWIENLVHYSNQ
jgi:hypothetical protein